MDNDDIDAVCEIAANKMPNAEYHNREHAEKVADEVEILAANKPVNKQVLKVAAYFHDTGHATGDAEGHEGRSCEIAEEVLLDHGFNEGFIEDVKEAIMGTVFLEEPDTIEGKLLSDADVWNFGAPWEEFIQRTIDVHNEFASEVPRDEWVAFRAFVMDQHEYYTEEGIDRYETQKQQNIQQCKDEFGYRETPPWE